LGLIVSISVGFVYFRDLGDVVQMLLKVKRANMVRFIRHEYQFLAIGLGGGVVMALAHFAFDAGPAWVFWLVLAAIPVLYGFPWVWVHLGLRNQLSTAKYYSIEDAKSHVSPASPVIVIENDGVARAHPDAQIMRPHLAGSVDGLKGENVVMTYCAVANLGLGYTPEIGGRELDLEVMAQHGNNLILRDNNTREPIQHIYGRLERDGKTGPGMKPWPTYRMTFRGFEKAYPDGQVYLNKPSRNPFLRVLDMVLETIFSSGIAKQHNEAAPVMDNMSHFDDRLPNKTYVWGVNSGKDAVCFTQDFVVEHGNLVNSSVDGRAIVVVWDPIYESLGVYYNDSGAPVANIDFFGNTEQGKLPRVESLKAGLFWHVWVEFFPQTDINRTV
jgi:hypothetical protein